jgi:hypothetical protein
MSILKIVDQALSIGLTVLSLGVVLTVGRAVATRHEPVKPSILDLPPSAMHAAKKTVLIAVSVRCPHCQSSPVLYRQVQEVSARDLHLRVIVAMPEAEKEVAREFLRAKGLGTAELWLTDLPALGITKLPTVLLIDSEGRVLGEGLGAVGSGSDSAQGTANSITDSDCCRVDRIQKLPQSVASSK